MAITEEDEEEEEEDGAEDEEEEADKKVTFAEGSKDAEKREQGRRLDLVVEASGFGRDMQRELENVSPFVNELDSGEADLAVHERSPRYARKR